MNPPYGRGVNVYAWVQKAFETAEMGGVVVCLLPASCDTRWFHDFVMRSTEIRFVKDRLWFSLQGRCERANHSSIVVVFAPMKDSTPRISSIPNYRVTRKTLQ